MYRVTLVAIAVAASWGYSTDQAVTPATPRTEKRLIAPPGPKPIGPYSSGIVAGDFLYVSGQGARDRDGQLPAAVDAQVRQMLDNVKGIVEAAGLTMEHVVYSQVYLRDMAVYDQMDRIWREYFARAPPARAVLGVYRMPTDTPVEISAVAIRDLSRKKLVVPLASPGNISWTPESCGPISCTCLFFGADATGKVPDSADAQVQLALDNMKQTLEAAGLDFRHVVFVNPYLTDKASAQMNAIYAKHFEFGNTPARATIRVASLPGGNTIQFTGVAVAEF